MDYFLKLKSLDELQVIFISESIYLFKFLAQGYHPLEYTNELCLHLFEP